MASDFLKPNHVHTLFPEEVALKMWPLPVRDLFFVGKSSEKVLHRIGIKTIGDLAHSDVKLLKSHLKKHGEIIYQLIDAIVTVKMPLSVRHLYVPLWNIWVVVLAV